ncbi:helix-turn-helix domain-containing protein [Streptomyces sp. NPDC059597]|uniref:helix-turn-helix domain-containing protein n=1 Tax=Streptomyces sp. NPDC059597 TaxID=3346879 RepID=UPI003673A3E7
MTATNDTPHTDDDRARDGKGKYIRSIDKAETDAEIARLYAQGHTYKEIGAELGMTKWSVIRAVQRAVRAVVQEAGQEALQLHVDRLEYLYAKALEIAEEDHVVVSHGRIVKDDDGNPVRDHAPTLAALREARASLESFRKLVGMDQPAKVEHSGGVTYELVGVNPEDLV